jgi:dihydroorotase
MDVRSDAGNMRIRISGGRVVDPENKLDAVTDIYVAEGRVVAIGEPPDGFRADRDIDATNCVVCPGFIDMCARVREPGLEHKATILTESRAAASGGITTLCCPPDTNPVIDTPAVVELIRLRAERIGAVRIVTLGAMTKDLEGSRLSEMSALLTAGCVGISNAQRPLANTQVARRAMEYAATFGITVFLYPDDPWLSLNGCAHEGVVATRLGLPAIPEASETASVARDLALIEQTGVRAHFCRLTTNRAVRMLARARYDGLPVTADVALPYLHLTESDLYGFNSMCHLSPPLRTQDDREGLRNGLASGTLTAICSDHQPHEADAKQGPFATTEPGISGLDTLLPLRLRLVDENILDLPALISHLTCGPARILGLPYGTLTVGSAADICIFDPDWLWELTPGEIASNGHNTPFMNWELKGRAIHTLLEGRVVFTRA